MSQLLATERRPKPAPRAAKPVARYRKGKLPKGVSGAAADSDEDEEAEDAAEEQPQDVPLDGSDDEDEEAILPAQPAVRKALKTMNVSLKDVTISKDGAVIIAGKSETGRTARELDEAATRVQEEEDEEEDDNDEEEEESEEEESEDEAPAAPAFRPVFVPKRARQTVEDPVANEEELQRKRDEEAEERRKQSQDMIADTVRRGLAEKEATELIPDVDDTDGLDPEAEFEAWRLRELGRIKRDKEEELRKEEERAELERRRAMPEEQRLKEDLEAARKSRDDKPKGKQKFLQKYWHKGAFHQDADVLQRHDFTEATESTMDKTMLPKVMQVKNFGKRSQTKYTHLLDQDTTVGNGGFGGAPKPGPPGAPSSSAGCFHCGGPHLKKDCPNMRTSNANQTELGQKGSRDRNDSRSWRDRDDSGRQDYGRDKYARYHEDRNGRGRSQSRSRSPQPRRDDRVHRQRARSRSYSPRRRSPDARYSGRRRSRSRSTSPRYRDEKRRRVD